MKKTLSTVLAVTTLLFASSCAEDKGTSTEVPYANEDENVNRKHIRDYYGLDSLARKVTLAGPSVPRNGQLATEIVKAYYVNDRDLSGVIKQFELSETTRMSGQAVKDSADVTSATDQSEQQSMRSVQDSINVVTGGINKADAKREPATKTTTSGSTKKQQSRTDGKSKQ